MPPVYIKPGAESRDVVGLEAAVQDPPRMRRRQAVEHREPRPLYERAACNAVRFRAGDARGHYESYFQRANHATRPLGFWIRYTLTVPRGAPDAALGELWAIYFDGERGRITACKQSCPLARCAVSGRGPLSLRIGSATLVEGSLQGSLRDGAHAIAWSLAYDSPEAPLLLLPERMYEGGFPKAKGLVGSPNAVYRGTLDVDGEVIDVGGWVGSQNHNWGTRHTDRYAWGQVAGFDGDASAFLECISARLRVGPVLAPALSMLVLRLDGQEYRLNRMTTAARATAEFGGGAWRFALSEAGVAVSGRIYAEASAFVALRYANPPGGAKRCMNSKIAACELVVDRPGQPRRTLLSRCRAALELLDDAPMGSP
jgi:hypothetical protein